MDSKDNQSVDSSFDSDELIQKIDSLVVRLTGNHTWRLDDEKINREVSELILDSVEEAFDGR